ncbi:MAG: hypothetical protein Q4A15_07325 [Prevotellaceae bacterium]|nr:hypothetical protein [Prevotellaceae bacterium]
MKKKYIAPKTKAIKVCLENHIANISGGGGDSMQGEINPEVRGNGGEGSVLGKEDGDFVW